MRVGMGTVFQNSHDRRPDREVYTSDLRLTELAAPLGLDSVWGVYVRLFAREVRPALQFLGDLAHGRIGASAAALAPDA